MTVVAIIRPQLVTEHNVEGRAANWAELPLLVAAQRDGIAVGDHSGWLMCHPACRDFLPISVLVHQVVELSHQLQAFGAVIVDGLLQDSHGSIGA